MDRKFQDILRRQQEAKKFLCVGLDPQVSKIPQCLKVCYPNIYEGTFAFLTAIVDATGKIAGTFKPNIAFFSKSPAMKQLLRTLIGYINDSFPEVLVILDFKRGDIGKTNEGYVEELNYYGADAMTINPYLGMKANEPFLKLRDKGVFILCHTSNEGADEFQDLEVRVSVGSTKRPGLTEGMPLYRYVARRVANHWNYNGNCGLVVGATYQEQLAFVRKEVGNEMPILIPGVGTQGGDLKRAVEAGVNDCQSGILINASSSIIHASSAEDFAEAALREATKLHDQIVDFTLP